MRKLIVFFLIGLSVYGFSDGFGIGTLNEYMDINLFAQADYVYMDRTRFYRSGNTTIYKSNPHFIFAFGGTLTVWEFFCPS